MTHSAGRTLGEARREDREGSGASGRRPGPVLHVPRRAAGSPPRRRRPPTRPANTTRPTASHRGRPNRSLARPDDQQAPEGQRVRGDHPLRRHRRHAHLGAQRGQRDVDDAEVEDDHERRPEGHDEAEATQHGCGRRARSAETASAAAFVDTMDRPLRGEASYGGSPNDRCRGSPRVFDGSHQTTSPPPPRPT